MSTISDPFRESRIPEWSFVARYWNFFMKGPELFAGISETMIQRGL